MKVREIITLTGWVDGYGLTGTQCYSDQVIDIDNLDTPMDWGWWATGNEPASDSDTKLTISHYAIDADPDADNPLATWSTWESDLVAARRSMTDLITLKQWADNNGIAPGTPMTWIKRGKLPQAQKVGRDWLIPSTTPKPTDRRYADNPAQSQRKNNNKLPTNGIDTGKNT